MYNHYDSYPEGLGRVLVEEIKTAVDNGTMNDWLFMLENIKVIDPHHPPPADEDIEKLSLYTDLSVGAQLTSDWYCLTHKCQGSFLRVLESGYLVNHVNESGEPIIDALFYEYRYILTLDDPKNFEYYENEEHIATYNLDALPDW